MNHETIAKYKQNTLCVANHRPKHTRIHMQAYPTHAHIHRCTYTCIYMPPLHSHTHTQDGFFPLYLASQEGYDGIVEMLLQAGATVDLQTKVEDCYYDSTLFICHL